MEQLNAFDTEYMLINMFDNRPYPFIKYHQYYYRYINNKSAPIQVLRLTKNHVSQGLLYCHYKLGDKTYSSTLTNTLSWLKVKTLVRGHYVHFVMCKKYTQLSIFDL